MESPSTGSEKPDVLLHYPAVYFPTARVHIAASLWRRGRGRGRGDPQAGEETENGVKRVREGKGLLL